MADNDYIHTAQVLKAAVPYLNSRTKTTIALVSSFMEFMGCLRHFTQHNLAACGFEEQTEFNLESLLTGIRPVCNPQERAFVDKILGIFNAKRMYETYSTYMAAMQAMNEFNADSDNEDDESMTNDQYMTNNENAANDEYATNDETKDDTIYSREATEYSDDRDYKQSDASDNINSQTSNSNMFDMLKNMIPPEQMSTFENLSMLFNMMSYDDNNKSNHEEGA